MSKRGRYENIELLIQRSKLVFYFKDRDEGLVKINSNNVVSEDIWYHVVVTRGDQLQMYVDGVLQDRKADVSGYDVATGMNLVLGNSPFGYQSRYSFIGLIDHFAMWNTELTAEEVAQIYNGGTSMDYNINNGDYGSGDSLIGFWRMDEGSGIWVADASEGYDNNASFMGGPVWSEMGYSSDLGRVSLYVNGDLYATRSFEPQHESSGTLANDLDLSIGHRKYPVSNHFGGQIDEVSVWSKALDPDDISSLFSGSAKRRSGRIAPDDLVLYLKFNESIGTTANDETINDNDAELPSDESKRPEWVSVDY